MGSEDGDVSVVNRAEIDTSAPFRSVKEAVMLFGERVLAGGIYANKLNEMRAAAIKNEHGTSRIGSITAELEETKQNLEKAREESTMMAKCLNSLKEELQKTKLELHLLKTRELEKRVIDSEFEDIKFVENSTEPEIEPLSYGGIEFQKKRSVKFASPPSLAKVMTPESKILQSQLSMEREKATAKLKKKPLIPLIGGIFSKKKSYQEGTSPKARRT